MCTAAMCESIHLGLARVPSLWLADMPLFLIASEGNEKREREKGAGISAACSLG